MTMKLIDKWEVYAKENLSAQAFGYLSGGAGSEISLKHNLDQFSQYRLIPRLLKEVKEVDPTVKILQSVIAAPFMLAPIGFHTIVHELGERLSAKVANDVGVPFIQSTVSSYSIEEVSKSILKGDHYFQLYWPSDDDVAYSFVRRAEKSGVKALIITVDTPVLGRREVDLAHDYFPMNEGAGMANFLTDPIFKERYIQAGDSVEAIKEKIQSILFNQTLTFDKVESLIKKTTLPVIIKGILHPEDARVCQAIGAAGIIVSNHGARQLDSAIEPPEVLEEIRQTVGENYLVLMDGGVRRGTDIIKAYLLGADSVLIGRPYIYGLSGGEMGVLDVLQQLRNDLIINLKLMGARSMGDLTRDQMKRL